VEHVAEPVNLLLGVVIIEARIILSPRARVPASSREAVRVTTELYHCTTWTSPVSGRELLTSGCEPDILMTNWRGYVEDIIP